MLGRSLILRSSSHARATIAGVSLQWHPGANLGRDKFLQPTVLSDQHLAAVNLNVYILFLKPNGFGQNFSYVLLPLIRQIVEPAHYIRRNEKRAFAHDVPPAVFIAPRTASNLSRDSRLSLINVT